MTTNETLRHTFIRDNNHLKLFGLTRFDLGLKPTVKQLHRWLSSINKRGFKSYTTPLMRSCISELKVETTISLDKLMNLYDSWDSDAHGWKMVKLLKKFNMTLKSSISLPKLLSLKFKVERNGKNPPYQDIKVSMNNGWYGFLNDRRVSISLQGFIKNYCKAEATTEFLKAALDEVCGYIQLDVKVRLFDGSSSDDMLVERVFTNVVSRDRTPNGTGETYPSVSGSCMKYESPDNGGDQFNDSLGSYHPSMVYNTSDIGIAWCEDSQGRTTMRCLLNRVTKTTCRYYGSSSGALRAAEEKEFFRILEEEHGFTRNDMGVAGCALQFIDLDGTSMVMPYFDNLSTGVLFDGETLRALPNGCDYRGNVCCGETGGVARIPDVICHCCGTTLDCNTPVGRVAPTSSYDIRPRFTCERCVMEDTKDETEATEPTEAAAAGCA